MIDILKMIQPVRDSINMSSMINLFFIPPLTTPLFYLLITIFGHDLGLPKKAPELLESKLNEKNLLEKKRKGNQLLILKK